MSCYIKVCRIRHNENNNLFTCEGYVSADFGRLLRVLGRLYDRFDIEFHVMGKTTELFCWRLLQSQMVMNRKLTERPGYSEGSC